MSQQLRLRLRDIGEISFQHGGNTAVKRLARRPQQSSVRGILDQSVLEGIGCCGSDSPAGNEPSVD